MDKRKTFTACPPPVRPRQVGLTSGTCLLLVALASVAGAAGHAGVHALPDSWYEQLVSSTGSVFGKLQKAGPLPPDLWNMTHFEDIKFEDWVAKHDALARQSSHAMGPPAACESQLHGLSSSTAQCHAAHPGPRQASHPLVLVACIQLVTSRLHFSNSMRLW